MKTVLPGGVSSSWRRRPHLTTRGWAKSAPATAAATSGCGLSWC